MTRKAVLFTCLLFVGFAGAPGVASELPHYDLDLRFDPRSGRLVGRALITVPTSALDNGMVRFDTSLSGDALEITRTEDSAGRPLDSRTDVPDGTLQLRLENGETTVDVAYTVTVDSSSLEPFGYYAFASFGSDMRAYPRVLRADGRPYRFADFRARFEHPSSLAVLTTGGLGERRVEAGRTVAHYSQDHVEGFAIIAGEGFEVRSEEAGGVPVVAFYHPDYAERFARVIEHTKEAAAWYRRTYGFFPLEQVGVVQGHPRWGGGYPLPNLFAIHLGNLDDEFLTWITAHELGHYYWGLYVLGAEERLDWVQLALGIWADQVYLAERAGWSMPQQWRRARGQGAAIIDYLEAVAANHEQRLGLTAAEEQPLSFDYNSLIRHGKAATGVYLQSLLVGRERFLDLQRQLLEDYRHRPLPADELVAKLKEAGAPDAPAFFEAWKRGDATIGVTVDEVEPDPESGGWRIELRRTGPVPYPVEIEAISASGETATHTVPADAERDTWVTSFAPAEITIDPRGLIPMWSSGHPEMRAAVALALERAGLDWPFVELAKSVLAEAPDDDHLRYRLVRRLYWLGRWTESASSWPKGRARDNRWALLAAIYSVRALARTGGSSEAWSRLDEMRAEAERFDLLSFWETVRDESKPRNRND